MKPTVKPWNIDTICVFLLLPFMSVSSIQGLQSQNFTCFKCSYSATDITQGFDCLNGTSNLAKIYHSLNCDRYCVTHERWNRRSRTVDSVFRSCNKYLGNECNYGEQGFINCVTSCRGRYCNNITVGESHVINFECTGPRCSKATNLNNFVMLFWSCIALFVFYIFLL